MKTNSQRLKWTKKEDEILKKLIYKIKGPKCWDSISKKLKLFKIQKKSKQCRQRWENQLNPLIIKKDLNLEQKKRIFILHKQNGSKWKKISENFEKRTDNFIKNHFFSLFRKGLRKSLKILNKESINFSVKDFKPRILSVFLRKKIEIKFKNEIFFVDLNEFFMKYIFEDTSYLILNSTEKDHFIIEKAFEYLRKLNYDYLIKKNKKIKKNKNCQNKFKFTQKRIKLLSKSFKNTIKKEKNENEFSEILLQKFLEDYKILKLYNASDIFKKLDILEQTKIKLNKKHKIFLKLLTKNLIKKEIFTKNMSNMININKFIHNIIKNMNGKNFEKMIIKKNKNILKSKKNKLLLDQKKNFSESKFSKENNFKFENISIFSKGSDNSGFGYFFEDLKFNKNNRSSIFSNLLYVNIEQSSINKDLIYSD